MIVSEGTSRNFKRRRNLEADGLQVRNHLVQRTPSTFVEVSNILTKEPSGPALLNNGRHRRPEPIRMLSATITSTRRGAARLAREARADDISGNWGDGSHVVIAGDAGPVFFEDASAEGIDFTESDGSHSGSLEPE